METTKLSTKGQVVLPKELRSARAWVTGTDFTVESTPDGVLLRPVARFPRTRLSEVGAFLSGLGWPH